MIPTLRIQTRLPPKYRFRPGYQPSRLSRICFYAITGTIVVAGLTAEIIILVTTLCG